jgi:hypothetical protein
VLNSPVSDSCNQRVANNVNNGIPTAGKPETTTLLVKFVCNIPACATNPTFIGIRDAQPPFIILTFSGSQLFTLDPGTFNIFVLSAIGIVFSGDCVEHGGLDAFVTINAGQHLTCNIITTP